jgi:glucose-1-phosphate cytidylyltransferase
MKVVLFCGGLGMRIREYSDEIPKPMVPIGYRPVLWHVMKYYAHWGHKDFILCLGHKADVIKDYFLNYDECISNDFTLENGGKDIELKSSDIHDWRITFVDTGYETNIGGRLRAVRKHLEGEKIFLANYSDNLTDVPLDEMTGLLEASDHVASFLCVRPSHSFHIVDLSDNHQVQDIQHVSTSDLRINGGYFVFRQEIFDYLDEGDELVEETFRRLIEEKRLCAYEYDGFFVCMDTYKERQHLEELHKRGDAPWRVWSPVGQP